MSMKPSIFLQDACLKHRYIRDNDLSTIVERPERLRALCLGIACAGARLELEQLSKNDETPKDDVDTNLSEALQQLNIETSGPTAMCSALLIFRSTASLDLVEHPAVIFAHGRAHIERIVALARESQNVIARGECEIPADLAKGDLYLCPESIDAMQGAVGTVCEAIDFVMNPTNDSRRTFVGIRPPGHHCGDESPSGFCWINNVAIGAAHAYLKHGVKKIVIFDIDLHHGNGTQSIAWSINEETHRKKIEREAGAPIQDTGPEIFYGSLHDILSYPCESGDTAKVQAASVSIHGPHGQYVENVHLEPYFSEEHFHNVLYKEKYCRLFTKARHFIERDNEAQSPHEVLFLISCGFDACEHEYKSMSRHDRKVPVGFYQRFTQDVCTLADALVTGPGTGRVVSVLEGGYSDRAIVSGSIAHIAGLSQNFPSFEYPGIGCAAWWQLDNLIRLEDAMKKRRNPASNETNGSWLERTMHLFYQLAGRKPKPVPPAPTMKLRDRRAKPMANSDSATMIGKEFKSGISREEGSLTVDGGPAPTITLSESTSPKKIPKVILWVGPRPPVEMIRKD